MPQFATRREPRRSTRGQSYVSQNRRDALSFAVLSSNRSRWILRSIVGVEPEHGVNRIVAAVRRSGGRAGRPCRRGDIALAVTALVLLSPLIGKPISRWALLARRIAHHMDDAAAN